MAQGLHEEFARDYKVEGASNKRFGVVVGGLFAAFGCLRAGLHWSVGTFDIVLWCIGGVLIVLALAKPDLLEALNRGWAKLGMILHKITNPIVLGVMYGGAIIPTGLMMRLFGVDPMGGRRRPDGATYWSKRATTASTAQSLEKPF
jgi:hypothetical protein